MISIQLFDELVEFVKEKIAFPSESRRPYLIGITGIPGSGKSTVARKLSDSISISNAIVGCDGYHLRKNLLTSEQLSHRGTDDTFSLQNFYRDLSSLRRLGKGSFPSFDHAVGDPVEDSIRIDAGTRCVLVEGLYVFWDKDLSNSIYDLTIFVECPLEIAMERIAKRHVQAGIVESMDEAVERANRNDRKTAMKLLDRHYEATCQVVYHSA